ncbi:hypothetical protein F5Y16DRAFT_410069 [Xylariaceae sp. FL0255]|nr:hypothetical protein F5Y16DRAFT_410069 [Xylariaceae sp. FL0255]
MCNMNRPSAPERIPTDEVIPLGRLDGTEFNASLKVDFAMQFDDALDVDHLIDALERLLQRPGWRKLGARLRRNNKGTFEYHVPKQYTKERPCIHLSRAAHDFALSEHPLASQLPRPKDNIHVTSPMGPLRPLVLPEGQHATADDWLYTDRAQLGVDVVTLTNATFVTLNWLHTLLNGMGRNELLRAWRLMLEGRDDEVLEFYGYDFDPLDTLGELVNPTSADKGAPVEDYVLKEQKVAGWAMLQFVFNYLWEILFYRSEELRTVILPNRMFEKLKAEAFNDLRLLHQPRLLPDSAAFIANCTSIIQSFFTLQELLKLPLGQIAARIRSDLVTQSTRPQIEAVKRLQRMAQAETGRDPLYGGGDMGNMFGTDFRAALVDLKDGKKSSTGKPVCILADATVTGINVRNSGVCLRKDNEGNWWLSATLRTASWDTVRAAIEGL